MEQKTITHEFELSDDIFVPCYFSPTLPFTICANGLQRLFSIVAGRFTVTAKLVQDHPGDVEVYFDADWYLNAQDKSEPTDFAIDDLLKKELGIGPYQKFYLNFS